LPEKGKISQQGNPLCRSKKNKERKPVKDNRQHSHTRTHRYLFFRWSCRRRKRQKKKWRR